MPAKLTTEKFIEKARLVHGNKYDYSKSVYVTSHCKLVIVCPVHGEFEQIPNSHLNGRGCDQCGVQTRAKLKAMSTNGFIDKAKSIHGDKYDYSKTRYVKSKLNVTITCPIHGDFTQTPNNHLRGAGCFDCGKFEMGEKQKLDTELWIEKAKSVHGDKYDYSYVNYTSSNSPVVILCKQHGLFSQRPSLHLINGGCNKCGIENTSKQNSLSVENFITKSGSVHDNKYDYSLVEYVNANSKVKIVCPIHGEFDQVAAYHMGGAGCQKCGIRISKPELAIKDMLDQLGVIYVHGDRSLIKPLELDFYLPEHNLAIEFNGLVWHSEEFGKDRHYHANKTSLCKAAGVRLVHIWEDDWNRNQGLELEFIRHLVGASTKNKVPARKCKPDIISYRVACDFMNKHHVQGSCTHSVAVGLFHEGELVTVTMFTVRGDNYELVRHANADNVIGSLGKTVSFFRRHYSNPIYTFCDNTRFLGDSYIKAGFIEAESIAPDYKYVVNGIREHKFLWRRAGIAKKLPHIYSEDLSERQMMEAAEIYRIWDCGKTRYVLHS